MAITRVQHRVGASGVASSLTVSFLSPTTTGTCIIVGLATRTGAQPFTSVTDTASNVYTAIGGSVSVSIAGSLYNQFWVAKNITGGFTDVTVNFTPSASASMFLAEYSGVSTTSPIGIVSVLDNQTTGPYTSPFLTITAPTSALVALAANNGSNITSVGAPWTLIDNIDLQATADIVPGIAGTYQATFSPTIGGAWCSSGIELLVPASAAKNSSMFLVF